MTVAAAAFPSPFLPFGSIRTRASRGVRRRIVALSSGAVAFAFFRHCAAANSGRLLGLLLVAFSFCLLVLVLVLGCALLLPRVTGPVSELVLAFRSLHPSIPRTLVQVALFPDPLANRQSILSFGGPSASLTSLAASTAFYPPVCLPACNHSIIVASHVAASARDYSAAGASAYKA